MSSFTTLGFTEHDYMVLYTGHEGDLFGCVRTSSTARQAMHEFAQHMQDNPVPIKVVAAIKIEPSWSGSKAHWRRGRHEKANL